MTVCRNYYLSSMRSFEKFITFSLLHATHTANKIKHLCVSECHCAFLFILMCAILSSFFFVSHLQCEHFSMDSRGACMETGNFRRKNPTVLQRVCQDAEHTYILMLNSLDRFVSSSLITYANEYNFYFSSPVLISLVKNLKSILQKPHAVS